MGMFNNIADTISYSCAGTVNKIVSLVRIITKKECAIVTSSSLPAPAAINLQNDTITFNPERISEMIAEAYDYETKLNSGANVDDICSKTIFFLTLHELGHFLDSPRPKMVQKYLQLYCSKIPPKFAQLVLNLVEDGFIQPHLMKTFRSKYYNDILHSGQDWHQGLPKIQMYKEQLDDGAITPYDVHNILYYFIMRTYNPNNLLINTLFDRTDILCFKEDTLKAFDKAMLIPSTEKRLEYTCKVVIQLMYRDIREHLEKLPPPPKQPKGDSSGQGDGEPQDGDDSGMGDDQQQSQRGQSGDDQDGDEDGSEGSQGDSDGDSDDTDDGDDSDGGGDGTDDDNPDDDDDGDSDDGDSDNDDDSDDDDDDDSDGDSDGSDDTDDSDSEGQGDGVGSGKDDIDNQIEKAAADLNKLVGQHSTIDKAKPEDLAKNIERNEIGINNLCKNCCRSHLPDDKNAMDGVTFDLLNNYDVEFARIYNHKYEFNTRLPDGELDEDLITEWKTEKNLNLFCQEDKLVQDKNIRVSFVLDRSGSMCGYELEMCKALVTALCHAFANNHIASEIYVFGSSCHKIKSFEDDVVLDGTNSNVQTAMNRVHASGGTCPCDTFRDIDEDSSLEMLDDNTVSIIFFITDGGISEIGATTRIVSNLRTKNYHLISIGLGLGGQCLQILKDVGSDEVWDVDSNELPALGGKIADLIIDNYVRT